VLARDGDRLDAVQVVVLVFGDLPVSVQRVQLTAGQVGVAGGDFTLLLLLLSLTNLCTMPSSFKKPSAELLRY